LVFDGEGKGHFARGGGEAQDEKRASKLTIAGRGKPTKKKNVRSGNDS